MISGRCLLLYDSMGIVIFFWILPFFGDRIGFYWEYNEDIVGCIINHMKCICNIYRCIYIYTCNVYIYNTYIYIYVYIYTGNIYICMYVTYHAYGIYIYHSCRGRPLSRWPWYLLKMWYIKLFVKTSLKQLQSSLKHSKALASSLSFKHVLKCCKCLRNLTEF